MHRGRYGGLCGGWSRNGLAGEQRAWQRGTGVRLRRGVLVDVWVKESWPGNSQSIIALLVAPNRSAMEAPVGPQVEASRVWVANLGYLEPGSGFTVLVGDNGGND